jgi:hypothetical protein
MESIQAEVVLSVLSGIPEIGMFHSNIASSQITLLDQEQKMFILSTESMEDCQKPTILLRHTQQVQHLTHISTDRHGQIRIQIGFQQEFVSPQ